MKLTNAPVTPEKIEIIQNMLNDPIVGELWREFVMLGQPQVETAKSLLKKRENAFALYAAARDAFLGLPPLTIQPVQGTHQRFRM